MTHKQQRWNGNPILLIPHEKGIKEILGKQPEIHGYAKVFGTFGSNKGCMHLRSTWVWGNEKEAEDTEEKEKGSQRYKVSVTREIGTLNCGCDMQHGWHGFSPFFVSVWNDGWQLSYCDNNFTIYVSHIFMLYKLTMTWKIKQTKKEAGRLRSSFEGLYTTYSGNFTWFYSLSKSNWVHVQIFIFF